MTGPGDLAGDSQLRVGHADRDQVVASLKDAFVAGMLTRDELDMRVGRALAARTRGDLAALTSDLPPVPAGMGRPSAPAPAGAAAQDRHPRPLARASAQSAGFLALAFGSQAFFLGQFVGKSEMIAAGTLLTLVRRQVLPTSALAPAT